MGRDEATRSGFGGSASVNESITVAPPGTVEVASTPSATITGTKLRRTNRVGSSESGGFIGFSLARLPVPGSWTDRCQVGRTPAAALRSTIGRLDSPPARRLDGGWCFVGSDLAYGVRPRRVARSMEPYQEEADVHPVRRAKEGGEWEGHRPRRGDGSRQDHCGVVGRMSRRDGELDFEDETG